MDKMNRVYSKKLSRKNLKKLITAFSIVMALSLVSLVAVLSIQDFMIAFVIIMPAMLAIYVWFFFFVLYLTIKTKRDIYAFFLEKRGYRLNHAPDNIKNSIAFKMLKEKTQSGYRSFLFESRLDKAEAGERANAAAEQIRQF